MFMCITKEKTDDTKKNYAPVLQHVKQPFVNYEFNLRIDSLALIGHNQTAPQIYSILVESVCRSLRLIERSIILSSNNTVKIPEMMHFKLPHCDHLVSIAYADTSAEKTRQYFFYLLMTIHDLINFIKKYSYRRVQEEITRSVCLWFNASVLPPRECCQIFKWLQSWSAITRATYCN